MMYKSILATLCAVLFSVVGCEMRSHNAVVGAFELNSATGSKTGQAFGIHFEAEGTPGIRTTSELDASRKSSSKAVITLADDLKIKLQTKPESEWVTFELNGKSFGDLKAGDKVKIAKDRSVTVNGEKRMP